LLLLYICKRLGLAGITVVAAMAMLFVTIYVVPGDPASVALGPMATPEIKAVFRAKLGLDRPLPVQFFRFCSAALAGDLGTDVLNDRPVAREVGEALPYTLVLSAAGLGWAILLGIPLGCLSALWRGGAVDRALGIVSIATIAVPSFVVALYSLLLFAVTLQWLPAIGAGARNDPWDQFVHLILPAFAIGLGWVGYLARLVRASMLEVLGEAHVRTARAFGLPERMIVFRYALKLAVLPTVALLGVGVGRLLSGAVFAEIVFSRPGVGKLVFDGVLARNFPLVSGTVLVTTVFFVFCTLAADLLAAWLDPRVRGGL
jgi:peptide/nickel transport system permease protein